MHIIVPDDPLYPVPLLSSNIAETAGYWSSTQTYALGALVRLNPDSAADSWDWPAAGQLEGTRLYKCIKGPCTAVHPLALVNYGGAAESALYWTDAGPAKQWAIFDMTKASTSTKTNFVFSVISVGYTGLLLKRVGTTSVTVTVSENTLGGPATVYTNTRTLNSYANPVDVVLLDLPITSDGFITVTFTGPTKLDKAVFGYTADLGATEYSPTLSIINYGKKITNADTGATTFKKGNYSKRMSMRMMFLNTELMRVYDQLATVRDTPCVWIAADPNSSAGNTFSVLTTYGVYINFDIEIAYANHSYCSLDIEGVVI